MEWLVEILQIEKCGAVEVTAIATMFLAALALLSLAAFIILGYGQLRQIRKEEHNEIVEKLIQTWESDSMLKSRQIFARVIRGDAAISPTLGEDNRLEQERENFKKVVDQMEANREDAFYDLMRIANHIETVAYMMRSKGDRKKIKDLMGDAVIYYFNRYESWIKSKRQTIPRIYEYFESLYSYCNKKSK